MSVVHRLDTLIDAVTARHGHSPMGLEMACVRLIKEQHAEIERLRTEVERLDLNGIHSCHDTCRRLPCVQRREIERLRAAAERYRELLQRVVDAVSEPTFDDVRLDYAEVQIDRDAVAALAGARAALEGER